MKKLNSIFVLILMTCNFYNVYAKLNSFGISDIIPFNKSFTDDNLVFLERISEEMGCKQDITIEIISDFLKKVEIYFNNILDNQNNNPLAIKIAKLAIIDIEKAKKMLKPENVDADSLSQLRNNIRRLDKKINLYKANDLSI
jgi:predicted glycosyl hydrolase (DUF1957 family)